MPAPHPPQGLGAEAKSEIAQTRGGTLLKVLHLALLPVSANIYHVLQSSKAVI